MQFLDSFSCATTNCGDDTVKHFVKVPYVGVNEHDVDTWVWRKPTSTGLFLNLDAICPLK